MRNTREGNNLQIIMAWSMVQVSKRDSEVLSSQSRKAGPHTTWLDSAYIGEGANS